jgi:transposase-like protein
MGKQPIPGTMLEAVKQFADPQVAHDFFVQIRFPNGVACPRMGCGSARVAYMEKVRRWYCNECKRQFSAKVGTIFEDSPIGLDKWLPAIWLIASNRNGISSCELARALGVTQKTAWFMLHRIREAMHDDAFRILSGKWENKPLEAAPRPWPRCVPARSEDAGLRDCRAVAQGQADRKGSRLGVAC